MHRHLVIPRCIRPLSMHIASSAIAIGGHEVRSPPHSSLLWIPSCPTYRRRVGWTIRDFPDSYQDLLFSCDIPEVTTFTPNVFSLPSVPPSLPPHHSALQVHTVRAASSCIRKKKKLEGRWGRRWTITMMIQRSCAKVDPMEAVTGGFVSLGETTTIPAPDCIIPRHAQNFYPLTFLHWKGYPRVAGFRKPIRGVHESSRRQSRSQSWGSSKPSDITRRRIILQMNNVRSKQQKVVESSGSGSVFRPPSLIIWL